MSNPIKEYPNLRPSDAEIDQYIEALKATSSSLLEPVDREEVAINMMYERVVGEVGRSYELNPEDAEKKLTEIRKRYKSLFKQYIRTPEEESLPYSAKEIDDFERMVKVDYEGGKENVSDKLSRENLLRVFLRYKGHTYGEIAEFLSLASSDLAKQTIKRFLRKTWGKYAEELGVKGEDLDFNRRIRKNWEARQK